VGPPIGGDKPRSSYHMLSGRSRRAADACERRRPNQRRGSEPTVYQSASSSRSQPGNWRRSAGHAAGDGKTMAVCDRLDFAARPVCSANISFHSRLVPFNVHNVHDVHRSTNGDSMHRDQQNSYRRVSSSNRAQHLRRQCVDSRAFPRVIASHAAGNPIKTSAS